MSKQREDLLTLLIDFCNQQGTRTFTLQKLNETYDNYQVIDIGGNTPQNTIRRLLQELRDEKRLHFLEEAGKYTLGSKYWDFLLKEEKAELPIDTSKESNPEKREYLRESYYRNTKMVRLAKERFGTICLHPKCENTFLKENQQPYIEVHHIIPLCKDGIDTLENLSVVCAHHHKMAHFADVTTKLKLEKVLLNETIKRL